MSQKQYSPDNDWIMYVIIALGLLGVIGAVIKLIREVG
jgi:hypothetical protein